jgi:hypothetical protein
LRQGDPLSPILFNIVVDMLAILIKRAKAEGQVEGLVPNLVDDGLSILQYADDTLLFLEHDLDKAENMKLLLLAFEQVSGLKINYHKSELFCFGQAAKVEDQYQHLFGCKKGEYPFKYLGIPMHYRKLNNSDWKLIEAKFEKKLNGWKGKLMFVGGRLVLINSVLTSLAMFLLSFFEVPRGVLERMDYFHSRFFWQGENHKKKYRLARWDILCQPKDQGGLGIQNIDVQNKCLLSKWLFKLINEDGMWQQLLRNKYLKRYPLSKVTYNPGDSHFWSGLMKVKNTFLNLGTFILKNGEQIRFWEDKWLGHQSFMTQYPSLYQIVRQKSATVATVFGRVPLNVSFRRALVGPNLILWHNLVARLIHIRLNTAEKDIFKWNLNSSGQFTVQSMYRTLINNGNVFNHMQIWKLKLPLKIKIFMWYLVKGVVLTKDNLAKRNWQGNKKCGFCNTDETIQHLFINCHFAHHMWRLLSICFGLATPRSVRHIFGTWMMGVDSKTKHLVITGVSALCWAIWISRNDLVFDKAPMMTYLQVLFRGTHWLRLWVQLQRSEGAADLIRRACRRLETVAMQIFAFHGWRFTNRIAL